MRIKAELEYEELCGTWHAHAVIGEDSYYAVGRWPQQAFQNLFIKHERTAITPVESFQL